MQETEQKKAYLKSYAGIMRERAVIREEIQQLYQEKEMFQKMAFTGFYSDTGKRSLKEYTICADELIEKLRQAMEEQNTHRWEIERRLRKMTDAQEKLLLKLRYIEGKTWEEIGEAMGYSSRYTFKIHKRALEHFEL